MRPINLNDALVLDRGSPQTLVRQLHGRLREMILNRKLKPGTELPRPAPSPAICRSGAIQ